mmetsp:Transcript_12240/g.39018  ORF Transcript_12240/g.39018 Transcript_12240/m.39018 type:complete len:251 (-) Transcript_12240:1087-1839(-)
MRLRWSGHSIICLNPILLPSTRIPEDLSSPSIHGALPTASCNVAAAQSCMPLRSSMCAVLVADGSSAIALVETTVGALKMKPRSKSILSLSQLASSRARWCRCKVPSSLLVVLCTAASSSISRCCEGGACSLSGWVNQHATSSWPQLASPSRSTPSHASPCGSSLAISLGSRFGGSPRRAALPQSYWQHGPGPYLVPCSTACGPYLNSCSFGGIFVVCRPRGDLPAVLCVRNCGTAAAWRLWMLPRCKTL